MSTSGRKLISIGVDVDAVAGWLGSYGGEDSPGDISRGMFAGEVGCPRLLKLFEKYNMRTTWFIPGHSLDTFPEEMAAVRDAGHEIGLHGYSHENPTAMSAEQQRDILEHTFKQLTDFCGGKPPIGSVAPWWEVSKEGTEMLLEKGIQYDHSFQHHDCKAYWLRMGDKWKGIDYKAKAKDWMEPLTRGEETGMVEIPANWDLDDLPPLMFIKGASNSHGFVDVHTIEQKWKDHLEYCYREHPEGFVMPITIHPDVSGRPHVLMMLERFIEWVNTHKDVEWVAMEEINKEFRENNTVPKGARMPAGL